MAKAVSRGKGSTRDFLKARDLASSNPFKIQQIQLIVPMVAIHQTPLTPLIPPINQILKKSLLKSPKNRINLKSPKKMIGN